MCRLISLASVLCPNESLYGKETGPHKSIVSVYVCENHQHMENMQDILNYMVGLYHVGSMHLENNVYCFCNVSVLKVKHFFQRLGIDNYKPLSFY